MKMVLSAQACFYGACKWKTKEPLCTVALGRNHSCQCRKTFTSGNSIFSAQFVEKRTGNVPDVISTYLAISTYEQVWE